MVVCTLTGVLLLVQPSLMCVLAYLHVAPALSLPAFSPVVSLWSRFCWGAGAAHMGASLIFYVVFAFVPLCIVPACLYLLVGVECGLMHFDRSAALGAALSLVCACIP